MEYPDYSKIDPDTEDINVHLNYDQTYKAARQTKAYLPPEANNFYVGLGWTTIKNLDLDASCVMLDNNFPNPNVVDIVSFKKKVAPGVKHSGDNTTGEGVGDDEKIYINLSKIPPYIASLYFTVNVYTENRNFSECKDSYVRLVDSKKKHTLVWYPIEKSINTRGMVFCKIFRVNEKWAFKALGWGCGGGTADSNETIDIVRGVKESEYLDIIANPEFMDSKSRLNRFRDETNECECECKLI